MLGRAIDVVSNDRMKGEQGCAGDHEDYERDQRSCPGRTRRDNRRGRLGDGEDLGSASSVTTSGPHAGSCENEDVLMLYAKVPFSVEVEGFGSEAVTVACEGVGG